MEPTKLLTIGLTNILQEIVLKSFGARGRVKVLGHYSTMGDYLKHSILSAKMGRALSSNDAHLNTGLGDTNNADDDEVGKSMAVDMADEEDQEPQVILIQSDTANECPQVLYQFPTARVVSLEDYGKYIIVWKLTPKKKMLGEVTSDELADYIFSSMDNAPD